ncbi:hypothetical protein GCM10009612_76000 [Streptomyces beijiangensis]
MTGVPSWKLRQRCGSGTPGGGRFHIAQVGETVQDGPRSQGRTANPAPWWSFAKQLSDTVTMYGLDGIDFDDEYA